MAYKEQQLRDPTSSEQQLNVIEAVQQRRLAQNEKQDAKRKEQKAEEIRYSEIMLKRKEEKRSRRRRERELKLERKK